jgi:carboxymethylenebutenolidase
MGQMITYQRPDGKDVQGYLAESGRGADGPALVVIQEWWGVNDQIRGVADRVARAGFTALVPDLYRGKSTSEAEEAHHLMTSLDFADAASQDVVGAVSYLKGRATKVGVTGFCMGGALTILASTMSPDIAAAVAWYGLPPIDYVNASAITAPLMGHWAEQDAAFAITAVDELEAKLAAAGVSYTGHRYLAHHGFANETAHGFGRIAISQYDPTWAQLAWDRTFVFLTRNLG